MTKHLVNAKRVLDTTLDALKPHFIKTGVVPTCLLTVSQDAIYILPLVLGNKIEGDVVKTQVAGLVTDFYNKNHLCGIGIVLECWAVNYQSEYESLSQVIPPHLDPDRRPGVAVIAWGLGGRLTKTWALSKRRLEDLGVEASEMWLDRILPAPFKEACLAKK